MTPEEAPNRNELLMLALLKELRRIGILSENELKNVVGSYIDLRALIPPRKTMEDLAQEPFTTMLTMMAYEEIADGYMKARDKSKEGAH